MYVVMYVCMYVFMYVCMYVCMKLLLLELTIPFDEYMAEAEVRKREKYRDLLTDIKVQGFDVTLTTVEVGSRGVISDSLLSLQASGRNNPCLLLRMYDGK